MKIEEINAKSILVTSKLPDQDYVANPYTGCQFGCIYCYATFMGRFVDEPHSNWGNYVYVKINAVELARKQLCKWSTKRKQSSILLSSVTDPYQGIERKYRLTRAILQVLMEHDYPGKVSILTKSPLVIRDIDFINQLNAYVGMTITTTDDRLSRFLEVKAPLVSSRLDTLMKLNQAGIRTYAFVGPMLPHFRYQPDLLEELFKAIAETGTQEVYVEHINLPKYVRDQMNTILHVEPPQTQAIYNQATSIQHRQELDRLVAVLIEKYELKLRFGGMIYHPEMKL